MTAMISNELVTAPISATPNSTTSTTTSTAPTTLHTMTPIVVLKRRWLLLITAALLNLTNAFHWLTFAPIATLSANYYNVGAADVDWFGTAFFIAGEML